MTPPFHYTSRNDNTPQHAETQNDFRKNDFLQPSAVRGAGASGASGIFYRRWYTATYEGNEGEGAKFLPARLYEYLDLIRNAKKGGGLPSAAR